VVCALLKCQDGPSREFRACRFAEGVATGNMACLNATLIFPRILTLGQLELQSGALLCMFSASAMSSCSIEAAFSAEPMA
jgi:hypothetical protein